MIANIPIRQQIRRPYVFPILHFSGLVEAQQYGTINRSLDVHRGRVLTTVLVVNDDINIRNIFSSHIEEAGFECLMADNGQAALEMIDDHVPDIVVIDLTLPEMDGLEISRRIRNSGLHSSIYIILVSNKSDANDRIASLNVGVDAFLIKPLLAEEVLAQIRAGIRTVNDRRSSMIDPLTGLLNRRSFDAFFDRETAEFERYQTDLSLAFLDVDHFKQTNDKFGYNVGDMVLKEIADLFRADARPSDLPSRWGGKKFAWLMPKTDLVSAKIAADRLRAAIAAHRFDHGGSLTVSLGIASARTDEKTGGFIRRAEEALRVAKNSGRNRVIVEGDDGTASDADRGSGRNVHGTGNLRVLIADDDLQRRKRLRSFAERHGFKVDYVVNAENFAASYRPDIDLLILNLSFLTIADLNDRLSDHRRDPLSFMAENKCAAAVILIDNANPKGVDAVKNKLQDTQIQVVGTLQRPLDDLQLNSLLEHATTVARSKHKINYPVINLNSGNASELPTIGAVRRAISNRELDVYFQPQIRLAGRTLSGLEALVRWNHAKLGFIAPDYVVAIAEKNNLIDELTHYVIERVCECCKQWENKWDFVPVSVNVSETSLSNLNFPDDILSIVQKYDVRPSAIMVELTETSLAADPDHVLNVLTRLHLNGFRLSIDDFGTGHSSLARLRKIPFRELKIDKMFVETCDTDRENRIIVSNTVNLAHSLGLHVVAEGVERETQLTVLEEMQCDHVQGTYFCRPLPSVDVEKWIIDRID